MIYRVLYIPGGAGFLPSKVPRLIEQPTVNFCGVNFDEQKAVNITGGKCLAPWPSRSGDEFGISVPYISVV